MNADKQEMPVVTSTLKSKTKLRLRPHIHAFLWSSDQCR